MFATEQLFTKSRKTADEMKAILSSRINQSECLDIAPDHNDEPRQKLTNPDEVILIESDVILKSGEESD